jgi:hypothetical protein
MISFLLDLSFCAVQLAMASIQPTQSENTEVVNILKRRCEVLEDQLARASDPKPKKYASFVFFLKITYNSWASTTRAQTYAGRPVRQLISFFDSVRDLVEENDRRLLLEFEALEDVDGNEQRESFTTIEYVHFLILAVNNAQDAHLIGKIGFLEDTKNCSFMSL